MFYRIPNTRLGVVVLSLFSVFENVVKHCLLCLIYHLQKFTVTCIIWGFSWKIGSKRDSSCSRCVNYWFGVSTSLEKMPWKPPQKNALFQWFTISVFYRRPYQEGRRWPENTQSPGGAAVKCCSTLEQSYLTLPTLCHQSPQKTHHIRFVVCCPRHGLDTTWKRKVIGYANDLQHFLQRTWTIECLYESSRHGQLVYGTGLKSGRLQGRRPLLYLNKNSSGTIENQMNAKRYGNFQGKSSGKLENIWISKMETI